MSATACKHGQTMFCADCFAEETAKPFALCCCGTPLVATFEMPKKEWYCVTCKQFYGWLHASEGTGPNPTKELAERCEAATKQYEAERAAREAGSVSA